MGTANSGVTAISYLRLLRWWHGLAVTMILTGALFPFYPQLTIAKILNSPHEIVFVVWCAAMVLCGIGLLFYPQWLPMWLVPLMVYVIGGYGVMFLGFVTKQIAGVDAIVPGTSSATAIIYYSAVLVIPLWRWLEEFRVDWFEKISRYVRESQSVAVLTGAMMLVLFLDPTGAGMDSLYAGIGRFVGWLIDPVLAYQLIYAASTIALAFPTTYPSGIRLFLYMPFVIHGFTFLLISVFQFEIYVLAPLFAFISVLWWMEGTRDDN